MSNMSNIAKKLKKALDDSDSRKPKGYDTEAVVSKVENKTLWVKFPGGETETPIRKTIDAKTGDTVMVRVSNHKAWAIGNATNPPTDDSAAKKAMSATKKVAEYTEIIRKIADDAGREAGIAMTSANGKNTVYHMGSVPSGGTYKIGDTWFNSNENYAMYTWDGTNWVKEEFGNAAIADLSITNGKIANATIESAKISGLDVGKLTGGYIAAGHINTGAITVGSLQDGADYSTTEQMNTAIGDATSGKADKSDANQYEQQIYYRTTAAKTFVESDYPTTFITTTTNVYNQWTRKVPPLAASTASGQTKYPYLYTCIQRKAVDGTVTHTAAALDSSITVIDGGNIVTGTVTANKLNASDINASNSLSIGALTTATQDDVLNSKMNIGGKNLLRNTGDYYDCSLPTSPEIYYNWADNGEAQICKYAAYTGDLVWDAITFRPFISYSAVRGKTVTLSFWYQSDSWSNNDGGHNYLVPSFGLYTAHRGVSRHKWYSDYSGTAIPTTAWKKYEVTLNITDALFNSGEGTISANDLFTLQLYRHNKSVLQIKKVKLEIGNKATDWTPAPEDLSSFTGENMLMDTNASSLTAVAGPAARYFSDVGETNVECSIVSISDAPIANINYGAKFIITAQAGVTTGGRCLAFYSNTGVKLTRRRVYTLSCWAKGTGNIRFQVGYGNPYYNNLGNGAYGGASNYTLSSSGWVKAQWSFYYDDQWSGANPIIYYGVWGNAAGTVYLCGFKLEEGNAAASWAKNTIEAGKTATNYITEIDTRKGIQIKPADASGNDYVQLNSSDLRFVRNGNTRAILQDDWLCLGDSTAARLTLSTRSNDPYIFMGDENNVQMFRASSNGVTVGPSASGHTVVQSDGLHVWTGTETSDKEKEAAFFGSTARIGHEKGAHTLIEPSQMAMVTEYGVEAMKIVGNGGSSTSLLPIAVTLDLIVASGTSATFAISGASNGTTISVFVYLEPFTVINGLPARQNFSVVAGTASSGSYTTGNTKYSYSYNGTSVTINANQGQSVRVSSYSYYKTTYYPVTSFAGDVNIGRHLKLGGHTYSVGTVLEDDGQKTDPAINTTYTLASITLSPGVWVVTGSVRFDTVTGGNRRMCIAPSTSCSTQNCEEYAGVNIGNNDVNREIVLNATYIANIAQVQGNVPYYLTTRIGASGASFINGNIRAVLIA